MTTTSGSANYQRLRMLNLTVIWADKNANPNFPSTKKTIAQLQTIIAQVKFVQDKDECFRLIHGYEPAKCFVICSGSLGNSLVPHIHEIKNLESIFIFCQNRAVHEQWTKKWKKIRGLFTTIDAICRELKLATKQCSQDEIAMSFIPVRKDGSTLDLNRLEPSFMYSNLLKGTILQMKHEPEKIKYMVRQFLIRFAGQDYDIQNINEFDKDYQANKAIWWYTRETFAYRCMNEALRVLDGTVIVDMAFFIHDLHVQIEKLHREQLPKYDGKSFTVFRGQGLSETDFAQLQKSKGGLLGFNCFLSTSKRMSTSLGFAERGSQRSEHVGIIFVLQIDPTLNSIPFADVEHLNCFHEPEIIFSMHTIFRIGDVNKIDGHQRMYQVSMTLTSEDDVKLKDLHQYFEKQTAVTGWSKLAWILDDMGEHEKAEEIYLDLLKRTVDQREKGNFNHQIGLIKSGQGKYQEAIRYYETAIRIYRDVLPENHPNLAICYNSIGLAHRQMSDYLKALFYYEESLKIRKKSLPENHPELATCYNNIGAVYYSMGENWKALSFYQKSLDMRTKLLPAHHPDMATSYNNIGLVYSNIQEYEKALKFFDQAFAIRSDILPANHADIAASYNNMAFVYQNMHDYVKALSFYRKALTIFEKSLPLDHPYTITVRESIKSVQAFV